MRAKCGNRAKNYSRQSLAQTALFHLRKAKSDAKVSMRAEVASATLCGPQEALAKVRVFEADFKSVGRIAQLDFADADELAMANFVLVEQAAE